eukprot:6192409-Pleurochrysis_carterae.AAC.2
MQAFVCTLAWAWAWAQPTRGLARQTALENVCETLVASVRDERMSTCVSVRLVLMRAAACGRCGCGCAW